MNIYLQGLTMGLAYVAPIGLQNLFVINSALTQKRSRVYITALIVILWDVSLGRCVLLGRGGADAGGAVAAEGHFGHRLPHRHLYRRRAPACQGQLRGRQGCKYSHLEAVHHRLRGHLDEPPGPDRRHHDAGCLPGHPPGRGRPALSSSASAAPRSCGF